MVDFPEYVCGFLFNEDASRVVLIRKNRPKWQAGKLNGVGGKIEDYEETEEAMIREFEEEAGLYVDPWELAVILDGKQFRVFFFRAFVSDEELQKVISKTEEQIEIWDRTVVNARDVVPNLKWILPFCADPCAELPLIVSDAPSTRES